MQVFKISSPVHFSSCCMQAQNNSIMRVQAYKVAQGIVVQVVLPFVTQLHFDHEENNTPNHE